MSQKSRTGLDGPITGGALAMTLYGLTVILASALLDLDVVPHSTFKVAVVLMALIAAGSLVGLAIDRRRAY